MTTKSESDKKLALIVSRAQAVGIKSFLLGMKNQNTSSTTVHFQDVGIRDALEIGINIIYQAVDLELTRHPEYSEDKKLIWKNFARQFSNLIGATDAALNKINNSNAPKQ